MVTKDYRNPKEGNIKERKRKEERGRRGKRKKGMGE